jgi:hypothetical protein
MHRTQRFHKRPRTLAHGNGLRPSDVLLGLLALAIARLIGF